MSEAGQAGLRLANLNNFSGSCGVKAILSSLVPVPEMISAREYWLSVRVDRVGGWISLHMKDALTCNSYPISRNYLGLGNRVYPGSTRLQMSKHQNIYLKSILDTRSHISESNSV